MAGDWIPIRTDLADDPAVIAITAATDCVDEDHTAGKLLRIWSWVDRHLRECNAPGVTSAFLNRLVGVTGFAEAMADVGWLETDGESITIPNFDRWFSQSGKRRAVTAKRVARHRAKCNAECNGGSVTQSVTKSVTTEEKRTEEKSNNTEQNRREDVPLGAQRKPCRATPDRSDDVRAVFAHYRALHPTAHPKPTSKGKAWRLIRARLDDGYCVSALCSAIDGCHKTPHNLGDNERGTKYLGLELIMRDAGQVARFIENDQDPPRTTSGKEWRTLNAAARFVERMTNEPT